MKKGKRLLAFLMALALFIGMMPADVQAAKKSSVRKITLNHREYVMKKGEKLRLKATVSPKSAKTKLIWKSSNKKAVSVSPKGVVRAKAAKGKAVITVKAGKKKASCKITIGIPVKKIIASDMDISVGRSAKILAKVSPKKSTVKKLIYKSSDPSVVSVKQGKITALKTGRAKIKITAADRRKVKKIITVTVTRKNSGVLTSTPTLIPKPTTVPSTTPEARPTTIPSTTPEPKPTTIPSTIPETKPTAVPSTTPEVKPTTIPSTTPEVKPTTIPSTTPEVKPTTIPSITPTEERLFISLENQELQIGSIAKPKVTFLSEELAGQDIIWKSSDDSIAAVISADGEIRGITPGKVTITATLQQDEDISASMEVTVSAVPGKNIITVQSGGELIGALRALENPEHNSGDDIKLIVLNTQEETVTIPEGNYDDVMLIVDAPNASIENKAQFKQILINKIAENTWCEKSGNQIFLNSTRSHLIVDANGTPNVYLLDNTELVTVDNKGNLQELLIASAAKVLVKGNSTASPIKCQCYNSGGEITTYVPLDIYSTTTYKLMISPGGEQTAVKVRGEDDIPEISGLGTIAVTIDSTGEHKTIIAENEGVLESLPTTRVIGRIIEDKDDPEKTVQAKVYLVNYSVKITDDNISVYLDGSETKKTETDTDGKYEFGSVAIGNYMLVAEVTGHALMTQSICIDSKYGGERDFPVPDIILMDEDGKVGSIYGSLIDASTGSPIDKGLTVILRKGIDNITNKEVGRVTSNEIGAYEFKDLIPGQYTIQVRDEAEGPEYVSTYENITIQPEAFVKRDISLSKELDSDEVRFVLNWGTEGENVSKDLDIYLYGPHPFENREYEVYFSGQQWRNAGYLMNGQYVSSFADLDVDDKEYEGPETITVKALTAGQYKIFVKDYTNGGSGDRLYSSDPTIRIYKGRRLLDTIHMPEKEGGIWFVGSYDHGTGTFKVADEVYSGEPNTSTRAQIGTVLNQLTQFDVIDPEAFSQDQSLIDEVTKNYLSKNTTDDQLQDYHTKINDLLKKLQDGLTMEQMEIEGGTQNHYGTFWTNHNLYSIYGTAESLTDLQVAMKDPGASHIVQEATDTGSFSHRLTLQNNALGVSTDYYFQYSINTEWVESITDPGNEGWETSYYYSSSVSTGGKNADIGRDLEIKLKDGISIDSMEYAADAAEGEWSYGEQVDLVIHLKKDATGATQDYFVYYKPFGADLLEITDRTNQIIEQGSPYYYDKFYEGTIDYCVVGEDLEMGTDWTAEVSPDASYETKTPEEYYENDSYYSDVTTVMIVTNPKNGAEQVYNIYYNTDTSDAEIIGIHDPGNIYTQYDVYSPAFNSTGAYYTINLQGLNSELGENLQVHTKAGAVSEIEYVSGSESWDYVSSNAKITVTAKNGKKRIYYVVYGKSNVSCNIRGISSDDNDPGFLKKVYLYGGAIHIIGSKLGLGDGSLVIRTNPGYTASYSYSADNAPYAGMITVKRESDGSEKIYQVYYTQDTNGTETEEVSGLENASGELQTSLSSQPDNSGNASNGISGPNAPQTLD